MAHFSLPTTFGTTPIEDVEVGAQDLGALINGAYAPGKDLVTRNRAVRFILTQSASLNEFNIGDGWITDAQHPIIISVHHGFSYSDAGRATVLGAQSGGVTLSHGAGNTGPNLAYLTNSAHIHFERLRIYSTGGGFFVFGGVRLHFEKCFVDTLYSCVQGESTVWGGSARNSIFIKRDPGNAAAVLFNTAGGTVENCLAWYPNSANTEPLFKIATGTIRNCIALGGALGGVAFKIVNGGGEYGGLATDHTPATPCNNDFNTAPTNLGGNSVGIVPASNVRVLSLDNTQDLRLLDTAPIKTTGLARTATSERDFVYSLRASTGATTPGHWEVVPVLGAAPTIGPVNVSNPGDDTISCSAAYTSANPGTKIAFSRKDVATGIATAAVQANIEGSPVTFTFTAVPQGTYTVTAVITDDGGTGTATSGNIVVDYVDSTDGSSEIPTALVATVAASGTEAADAGATALTVGAQVGIVASGTEAADAGSAALLTHITVGLSMVGVENKDTGGADALVIDTNPVTVRAAGAEAADTGRAVGKIISGPSLSTAQQERILFDGYDVKLPGETMIVGFDFASLLVNDETIVESIAVRCTAVGYEAIDPNPQDVILGPPQIAPTAAFQFVTGGVAGVNYLLTCTVRTTEDRIVVGELTLRVRLNTRRPTRQI